MNPCHTMHDPPHPGGALKELYLVPLGLTVGIKHQNHQIKTNKKIKA